MPSFSYLFHLTFWGGETFSTLLLSSLTLPLVFSAVCGWKQFGTETCTEEVKRVPQNLMTFWGLLQKWCVTHSVSPVCRSTRTPAPPAARGPAPRVPHLGLHRPAQLGAAHHPHGGPGLPRHGPQQDSHHWQDQVRRKPVWPTPPRFAIYGTPQISLSSTFVVELTATCKHFKSRTAEQHLRFRLPFFEAEMRLPTQLKLTLLTLVSAGYGWTALGFLMS